MKSSLNLTLFVWCIWLNVSNNQVEGEINEQCKVDCACCIDRKCGPGHIFSSNECTLGCIDGHRGLRCFEICTHNCTKCYDHVDTCTECYDGYYLGSARDCTSQCLPGCKTCTSGTTCTSCKEGYYNDNRRNDCSNRICPENCNCDNGQCTSCKDGYYDTSNKCNSLCPGNCVTCTSNTNCGSCMDGYYKGYQYDNNNTPLLNDCSYKCRDNCVQCSSYNSCSICKTGLYGSTCENSCSIGCISNTCDILTGNCHCSLNFVGERCDKCTTGRFGNLCDQQCPPGCKSNVCDKNSGDCTDGCTSGYFNDQCDKQCPQNCLKSCHIETGLCDGCNGNFYGESCNCACASACKIQATANGSICQQSNGKCLYGCIDGLHGSQCTEKCSVYCNDILCIQDDGKCTKGCKTRVKNDHICPLVTDSRSSEQSVNIAAISLGTILVVSVVVNIILVVTLILWKYRKRVNDTHKTKEPAYENSGIELECGNLGNAGSASKHGIVQATKSDTVLKSSDYEDLGRVQVSEHEYGEIRTDI